MLEHHNTNKLYINQPYNKYPQLFYTNLTKWVVLGIFCWYIQWFIFISMIITVNPLLMFYPCNKQQNETIKQWKNKKKSLNIKNKWSNVSIIQLLNEIRKTNIITHIYIHLYWIKICCVFENVFCAHKIPIYDLL